MITITRQVFLSGTRWAGSIAAATVLASVGQSALAQTVSDASFETPALATNQFLYDFQMAPGSIPWTLSGTTGVRGITTNGSIWAAVTTNAVGPTPAGLQMLFIQGEGNAKQTVNFPAGTFVIKVRAIQRNENQDATGIVLSVWVDGVQEPSPSANPGKSAWAKWCTQAFTVAAGNHTIKIVGQNPAANDNTIFIDDVQVTSAAPTLANPDFETPALSAGQYKTSAYLGGNAWSFSSTTGVSGISSNGSPFTHLNEPAPGGAQVGFVQGIGTIQQTVTFPAGGTYNIVFKAAQRPENQAYQNLSVKVGSTQVGQFTPVGSSFNTYTTAAFTVSAGASKAISFNGLNSVGVATPTFADNTVFIDSVSIIPSTQTPPPTDLIYIAPDNAASLSAVPPLPSVPSSRIFGLFSSYPASPMLPPEQHQFPALLSMDVRHIGTYAGVDANGFLVPSTDVKYEAQNPVKYALLQYTGFDPDQCPTSTNCPRSAWQLGATDDYPGTPIIPHSGFQLRSTEWGMFIDTQTFTFSPSNGPCVPTLQLGTYNWQCGGPQASLVAFITGTPVVAANSPWAGGGSYEVEAFMSFPYAAWGSYIGDGNPLHVQDDGLAQLALVLHLCDTTGGGNCPRDPSTQALNHKTLNLVVLLADTRASTHPDLNQLVNIDHYQVGSDANQPFMMVVLPTSDTTYITRRSASCTSQFRVGSSFAFTNCLFKARITAANLQSIIQRVLAAAPGTALSYNTSNYVPILGAIQLELPVQQPPKPAGYPQNQMRAWSRAGVSVNNFSTRQVH